MPDDTTLLTPDDIQQQVLWLAFQLDKAGAPLYLVSEHFLATGAALAAKASDPSLALPHLREAKEIIDRLLHAFGEPGGVVSH